MRPIIFIDSYDLRLFVTDYFMEFLIEIQNSEIEKVTHGEIVNMAFDSALNEWEKSVDSDSQYQAAIADNANQLKDAIDKDILEKVSKECDQ